MKTYFAFRAALLTAMALPLTSLTANAQKADVSITAVTQVGPTFPQYTQVDIPLLRDALPKKSNGRIAVKLYSYPEMNVNGPEVIRLVRSGQVEIGAVTLATVSGEVPLLDGFDLAGLNTNLDQSRKIADALLPAANQRLERLGVKIIATYSYTPQMLFCRRPVTKLSDLKGQKVRVAGPSLGAFVESFGGQSVSMAFGEVYTALERGTVDCAVTGVGSGNSVKWYEVTSSLYTSIISGATAGYFVNLSWWNKLDPQIRNMVEGTLKEVQEAQWKLSEEAMADGVACNLGRANACKIHTLASKPMTEAKPAAGERAEIEKALAEKILPGWVSRCGAECGEIYNRLVAPISNVQYVK